MTTKEHFDFKKVEDFDKHIAVSIPNYKGLCDVFRAISVENLPPYGEILDVGCSTGGFLEALPAHPTSRLHGVDIVDIRLEGTTFIFHQEDAATHLKGVDKVDVVVVMFTLQFLGGKQRSELLNELVRLNRGGATILIAEKVFLKSSKINQILHKEHTRAKRLSFSDKEILDKDYQLAGTMFCRTEEEIEVELNKFGEYTQVWQSYNFKAWCIEGKTL